MSTNSGGGKTKAADGTRGRLDDQGYTKMQESAINARDMNQYVGVVVGKFYQVWIPVARPESTNAPLGESCPLMPTKVPHAYNVLDWYFVTDVWCEKNKRGSKFWKMRLELTDPTNSPWWAPLDSPEPFKPLPGDYTAASEKCKSCGSTSKRIFSSIWTCLNYECGECFNIGQTVFEDLEYSEEFLRERRCYTGKVITKPGTGVEFPPSIVPPIPSLGHDDTGSEKHMGQGFVCPRCSGCSPRSHWAGWFCGTPGCGFKQECAMRPIPITKIDSPSIRERKFTNQRLEGHPEMVSMAFKFQRGGYEVTIYPLLNLVDKCELPSVVGVLAHLRPSADVRAAPNGPDDSFMELHEHAAKDNWKRLPVRLKGGKWRSLCC